MKEFAFVEAPKVASFSYTTTVPVTAKCIIHTVLHVQLNASAHSTAALGRAGGSLPARAPSSESGARARP